VQSRRNVNHPFPNPDFPEPVEGLLFLQAVAREARSKGRPFDRLREVGFWGQINGAAR
jgi:hypothetical protein